MARGLFREGLGHARAGRWEQARERFARSYAVAPVPVTLLNLAGAQVQLGQLVAGLESYRNFLSVARGSRRAARYVSQAEEAVASLEGRIAHLRVTVEGLREADVVRVGDQEVSHAVLGGELPVDPGELRVEVLREGTSVAETSITLAEGEARSAELAVATVPTAASAAQAVVGSPDDGSSATLEGADEDDDDGGGLWRSPWLWTGVGAVVVGAVVVGAVVASSGSADPYSGNLGSGGVTFR